MNRQASRLRNEMRIIIVLALAVHLCGCGRSDLPAETSPPPLAPPDASPPALPSPPVAASSNAQSKSLRAFVLSRQNIHDEDRTYSLNGNSWSFSANGTFSVGALTGRRSWTATGSWSELPDGRLSLMGTQENAFSRDFGTQPYARVLGGYHIVKQSEDGVSVRFD